MKPEKLPYIDADMPNDQYHRGEWQKEFISSTQFKNYIISPKYFLYCRENPNARSISLEASMQGSVYHSMLASLTNKHNLEDFEKEYFVFEAPINQKTGSAYGINTQAYLAAYNEALAANPGREATSEAEVKLAKDMIHALLNYCGSTSDSINRLIEWGTAETSFFLEYEGMGFKFRTDLQTENKIVDWKTISADDLHKKTIQKQIDKMHYGLSAAFYQFFLHEITGQWKEFYWVFQQKSAPYDAVLVSAEDYAYKYNPNQDYLQRGPSAQMFEAILEEHKRCYQDGYFPGAEIFLIPSANNRRIMYPSPNQYDVVPTYFQDNQ